MIRVNLLGNIYFVEFFIIVLIKFFERVFSGLLICVVSIYGFICRKKKGILCVLVLFKI